MVIAVSVLSGALFVCVALFLLAKLMPPKVANNAYYKRHLDIVEAQLKVFNERMVEERRLADALEIIVAQITSTNSQSEPQG
jgi:hypothetical protein